MNNSEIKRILFHPNTHKPNFIAQLKLDSTYSEFKKKINRIKQHPYGKAVLNSNPLPKDFSQIRRTNIIPHSGNIEAEIAWLMDSLIKNADSLNKYVKLKEEYEISFLLGKYEVAEKILGRIESQICVSIWGAENKLLLTEDKSGTEENWLLLDKLSKEIKDPFSLFLIEQSSKKAENKFSYIRYKNNFENIIEGTSKFLHEYLCFRILYPGYTGFQNFSFLINLESVSPIIDRYNLLIDILIELLPIEKKEFILKVVSELYDKIPNDIRLKQLHNLLSAEFTIFVENNSILDMIDFYSEGKYEKCINEIPKLLKIDPSIIELYVIYVKSLIELNIEYKPIQISNSIEEILSKLYNIYSVNDNFNSSIEDILKLSLKYFSFNFGKQLFGIISEQANLTNDNNIHQLHYTLNSKFNNPKILNFINSLDSEIIENAFSNFAKFDNLSAKINVAINEGNVDFIDNNTDISDQKKFLYIAKSYLKRKENKSIIQISEKVIKSNDYSIITKKEIIEILYNTYLFDNNTERALILYINSFFENHNLVNRLDNARLLKLLDEKEVEIPLIDLPIFFYLSNPDIYEQYVRYDEFLEMNNIERPNQLFSSKNIQTDKLIFFLKEVCNIDVMHHSLYFDGTDDIENERLQILKHLLIIDKKEESEYIKEITEITQKTKIRKAIREVNKGRITINSQQLKNKEENSIKDNFIRFKELVVFSKNHNLKTIDPTSKMLNEYFNSLDDQSMRDKIVNINDPAYISFKAMFIDLRDKFILSKDFGLDGYLSTRIRHGTYLNHIRSIFESFNLISQKKEDTYIQNDYWLKKTPNSLSNKKEEIQTIIKEFSKQIDDLTEYIIKELIQVKTEKYNQKPNALFNFTLEDQTLAYLFKDSKDNINTSNLFLDYVFENLEALMKIRLKEIRLFFVQEVKTNYTRIIDDFDNNIRDIIGTHSFIDMTNSIVKCKTNIQNELDNIAEWFNISNPSSDNLLDFDTIIKTAVEITNTIYPQKQINPKIVVDNKIHFAGGINVIYLIRILLDNIIKHSELQNSKFDSKIKVDLINDKALKLSISNAINSKYSSDIEKKLSTVKEKWNNDDDFSKSNIEGGSGFDKIRRILSVDMKMKDYSFDFSIANDILTIHIIMEIQIYETEKY